MLEMHIKIQIEMEKQVDKEILPEWGSRWALKIGSKRSWIRFLISCTTAWAYLDTPEWSLDFLSFQVILPLFIYNQKNKRNRK